MVRLRSNNMLERIMNKIRRRTRVVGVFPDGQSALMPFAARLRHVSGTKWETRRSLDKDRLGDMDRDDQHKETSPTV